MLADKNGSTKSQIHLLVRDEGYWQALLALADHALAAADAAQQTDSGTDTYAFDVYNSADSELWLSAETAMEADEPFDLDVLGFNKGGLLVEWQGLSGFVPASHLIPDHLTRSEDHDTALQARVGTPIRVKLIEVSPQNRRLIFSERAAQVDADTRQSLWERIAPDMVLTGTITNLTDFGAFVDLGGVEGLIHISELSWSRLDHPGDIVEAGQEIEVKVLQVDHARKRVALSNKRTRPDPWQNIEQRYKPNQLVEGRVRDVVQYGAFVTLEDELEGLIHVSELAEGSFLHPRNVVRKDQHVVVRVLQVNPRERRIALSLRGIP